MASAEGSGDVSGDDDEDHTQDNKDKNHSKLAGEKEPDIELMPKMTDDEGNADVREIQKVQEQKVDLPFVINSSKGCLYTQPGIVQVGQNCVVVTLNFDTPLVSQMLEKGNLNVQLSSGGVLVDVEWPGKQSKRTNIRIKASIIERIEKVKEKLEQRVISKLFDESNNYETLRSVIQMLYEVEAFVDKIKGGCIEFWIACENRQRMEKEMEFIQLFLAKKLLLGENMSVFSVSILDVESATYRSAIPTSPKETPSNEETGSVEKQRAQGKPKPKRLPSVQGKTKKSVQKDSGPVLKTASFLWMFFLVLCVAALLIRHIQDSNEIQNRQNQVSALEILKIKLETHIADLKRENQRLEMRLSEMMRTAVKDANGYRQTEEETKYNIASEFKGLYDNEYTRASIELEKLGLYLGTENMTQYLLKILRVSDSLCRRYSTKHLNSIRQSIATLSVEVPLNRERLISSEALSSLKDKRATKTKTVNLTIDDLELTRIVDIKRTAALKFQSSVIKNLYETVATEFHVEEEKQPKLASYINKCLQLCWMIYMHAHPVFIDFVQHSTLFDTDMFQPFLSPGKYIAYIVWPPVYLYYGGNMLSKGIAEGKD